MALYDEALKQLPKEPIAWMNRGNSLMALKRMADALKSYDRALDLKPDYAKAWCLKGMVLDSQNRHVAALEAFSKAISYESREPRFFNYRAELRSFTGDYAGATRATASAVASPASGHPERRQSRRETMTTSSAVGSSTASWRAR